MGKSEKSKAVNRRINRELWHKRWQKVKIGVINALFPEAFVCLDCEKELSDKDRVFSMCQDCLRKLPYITTTVCRHCGAPLEQRYNVCKRCQSALPYFDKAYAPFAYEGFIRKMVLSYKDGNANYLYRYIVKFMSDYYNALGIVCDAVCYVPSEKEKILRRGFEHNRKVTELFAEVTQTPLIRPLQVVKRIKDQTGKKRIERLESIKGVYAPVNGFNISKTSGKRILLIDDVMTTGATAGECARVLKEKLAAAEVIVLTLARS